MGNSIIKSYEFTRLAEEGLMTVEKNNEMIEQIRFGNPDAWEIVFNHILDNNYSFFDFIKRYLCQKRGLDFDSLTHEKLMQYIRSSFFDNQMDNVGSLTGSTNLTQCLRNLKDKSVIAIKRPTCFLFFFGLGMDEKEASQMLTKEFLQADFNVRDPEEMIYFYCLKHHLKYPEIEKWRKIYSELPETASDYKDSLYLNGLFEPIRDSGDRHDEKFKRFLTVLKNLSSHYKRTASHETHFHPVSTREKIYRSILSELEGKLSPNRRYLIHSRDERKILCERKEISENRLNSQQKILKNIENQNKIASYERTLNAVDYNQLDSILENFSTEDIIIPEIIQKLIQKNILVIPNFTKHTIKKRIHDRTSHITREDILTVILLLCAYDCRFSAKASPATFQKRRSRFENLANSYLSECGFYELYLLNPFELFLTTCLFYEEPFKYFLAVLRYARSQ